MAVLARALAALSVCLAAAPAAAQAPPPPSPTPTPSPAPPDPAPSPRDPLAPDPPDEEALRAETARLAVELMTRRTRPARERVRLEVSVLAKGALVDRSRVLDVSVARADGAVQVRVRFREPAALRGAAVLVRDEPGQGRRAWRYDPARRRVERLAAPQDDERLGGTGLTWADLRGEEPARWRYRLGGEGRLELPGGKGARDVLQVSARARDARAQAPLAGRRLHLDKELKLPLRIDEVDAEGALLRTVWLARWRKLPGPDEAWRADARTIVSPGGERVSEVIALERSAEVPAWHLDPDRFGDE